MSGGSSLVFNCASPVDSACAGMRISYIHQCPLMNTPFRIPRASSRGLLLAGGHSVLSSDIRWRSHAAISWGYARRRPFGVRNAGNP
jgi:hypothetical protein